MGVAVTGIGQTERVGAVLSCYCMCGECEPGWISFRFDSTWWTEGANQTSICRFGFANGAWSSPIGAYPCPYTWLLGK